VSKPVPTGRSIAADAAGFALGLMFCFALGWNTTDLVWSLWLSSLVIGLATIWIGILRTPMPGPMGGTEIGKLLGLLFFAVHFGGFHFVHSQFLALFFPLGSGRGSGMFLGGASGPFADYGLVFASYWPWLFAAAIAERGKILDAWNGPAAAEPTRLRGDDPLASLASPSGRLGGALSAYANVVRMHLLIFFFAFTSMVGLDGFLVYAVVYAAYFWPWRRR
jgi:hypothetical protein